LDTVKPPETHKAILFLGSLVTTGTYTFTITVIPRLTSDPANEFFG